MITEKHDKHMSETFMWMMISCIFQMISNDYDYFHFLELQFCSMTHVLHYIPLQQPRASSAAGTGYFTNILTQEEDDDLELLRQQDATPSNGGKSKRGSNYTNLKDI
jgi:hypothetical protein